jgi:hypothetical protein
MQSENAGRYFKASGKLCLENSLEDCKSLMQIGYGSCAIKEYQVPDRVKMIPDWGLLKVGLYFFL